MPAVGHRLSNRMPLPCECGNHFWCGLTKGFVTLVSPGDEHHLINYGYTSEPKAQVYARRNRREGGRTITTKLHREIMTPPDGMDVDHINRNGCDNRRQNLRVCTRSENLLNTKRSVIQPGVELCAWGPAPK